MEERKCRVCGCTDNDCTQCIEAQGFPCCWVSKDLCSRCIENIRPAECLQVARTLRDKIPNGDHCDYDLYMACDIIDILKEKLDKSKTPKMVWLSKLSCKLGIHRPLTVSESSFIDKVSGKTVYKATCNCGRIWLTDNLCGWLGYKCKILK